MSVTKPGFSRITFDWPTEPKTQASTHVIREHEEANVTYEPGGNAYGCDNKNPAASARTNHRPVLLTTNGVGRDP